MCRVVDFFYVIERTNDEVLLINTCKLEQEFVRNFYSTPQSMKTKFSQYRTYLQNEYYKNNPILGAAIQNIDLLRLQDNTIDKAILLAATNYSLALSPLKTEYTKRQHVLNILKITDEETRNIKTEYNAKVKERRSNLRYILDVEGYINRAVELLNSSSFIDNVLGLAALTGRRVAEIGCTAQFEYISDCEVAFKGQLKTKDSVSPLVINIPVLADSNLIITALKNIRQNFGKYLNDPIKFHNNCSTALSKKAHLFESFVEEKVTPKDLRAIYASIAFKQYCSNDRMDDTVYYSNILGHDEKDVDTCLSYTKYKIKN